LIIWRINLKRSKKLEKFPKKIENLIQKLENDSSVDLTALSNLGAVTVDEVLNEKHGEYIALLGKVQGQKCTVTLRKCMPKSGEILSNLDGISLNNKAANKAYASFEGTFPGPGFKVDMYCPAAEADTSTEEIEKLINKKVKRLRPTEMKFVRESMEDYTRVSLPYIESIPKKDIQWLHNIVDNLAKEQKSLYDISKGKMNEKVVYSEPDEKTGFGLLVDFKWRSHPKTMALLKENPVTKPLGVYCIAFPVRKDIRSLRDLTAAHLPLLRNIRDVAYEQMSKVYGVEKNKLRLFVHYHPQYYYFHVHVTSMDIDYGIQAGRARLLEEIISNLEIDGSYYQKKLLFFALPANHDILKEGLDA